MLGTLVRPLHITASERTESNFKEVQQVLWNDLSVLNHSRIYYSDNELPCTMCMNNSEVTDIVRQDSNQTEKPFSCKVCGRCFTQAADVTRHTRVHTGEKPYICAVCGKSFSQSGDLTRHTRIHTGEKPFSCAICMKSFTQSGSLTRHLRVHTGEKPFSCAICMRSFSQSGDSIRHIRVHKSGSPLSSPVPPPQTTNVIQDTIQSNIEQKLLFSDVLSMAFSHATNHSHNSRTTYNFLTENEPSLEIGTQRNENVLDLVASKLGKRSKLEKFPLDTFLLQNKINHSTHPNNE